METKHPIPVTLKGRLRAIPVGDSADFDEEPPTIRVATSRLKSREKMVFTSRVIVHGIVRVWRIS